MMPKFLGYMKEYITCKVILPYSANAAGGAVGNKYFPLEINISSLLNTTNILLYLLKFDFSFIMIEIALI